MNKADWKTKTAGILGALYGLISVFVGVISDPDPEWIVGMTEALGLVVGGLAVFGLGAKIQKLIDALKK